VIVAVPVRAPDRIDIVTPSSVRHSTSSVRHPAGGDGRNNPHSSFPPSQGGVEGVFRFADPLAAQANVHIRICIFKFGFRRAGRLAEKKNSSSPSRENEGKREK
jgi:hypothetical protein